MARKPNAELKAAVEALAPVGPLCVACRGRLVSPTRMQCGDACRNCFSAYMNGHWDGQGYSEARETRRLEHERKVAA